MTRSRRAVTPLSRLAIAAIAAGLVPAVAACDAGSNAPTLQFHPQSNGVNAEINGIQIRDAFVLGAAPGSVVPAGQSTGIFLALYNSTTSADVLSGATAAGVAASVTVPANGIRLGSSQAAYLTGPKPEIVLTGLTRDLQGGTVVRVTLSFVNAGSITLNLPVIPRSSDYATFSPVPSPSPTATATKTGKTGVRPSSPPATGSPPASTTASPNPTA